jgi:hypothetical protein
MAAKSVYPWGLFRLSASCVVGGFLAFSVLPEGSAIRLAFGSIAMVGLVGFYVCKFVELRRLHRIEVGRDPLPGYVCSRCLQRERDIVCAPRR